MENNRVENGEYDLEYEQLQPVGQGGRNYIFNTPETRSTGGNFGVDEDAKTNLWHPRINMEQELQEQDGFDALRNQIDYGHQNGKYDNEFVQSIENTSEGRHGYYGQCYIGRHVNSIHEMKSLWEPSVVRKRNERERLRVRNVNSGFVDLRNKLPLCEKDKNRRLSKVEILRMAITYIQSLQRLSKESVKGGNN